MFSVIDASTIIVHHFRRHEAHICRKLGPATVCQPHAGTKSKSAADSARELRALYPGAPCKSRVRISFEKSDKIPQYYAVQRKSQIPAPKEAAEPALDALLDEKRAEKAMYASRFGKEPKTFEDAVAIFAGPLKRSPATYYASSAASQDAGVSNVRV